MAGQDTVQVSRVGLVRVLLVCSCVSICLLSVMGTVLWLMAPKWWPEWVYEHSPFVGPAVQAVFNDQIDELGRLAELRIKFGDVSDEYVADFLLAEDQDLRMRALACLAEVKHMTPTILHACRKSWDQFKEVELIDVLYVKRGQCIDLIKDIWDTASHREREELLSGLYGGSVFLSGSYYSVFEPLAVDQSIEDRMSCIAFVLQLVQELTVSQFAEFHTDLERDLLTLLGLEHSTQVRAVVQKHQDQIVRLISRSDDPAALVLLLLNCEVGYVVHQISDNNQDSNIYVQEIVAGIENGKINREQFRPIINRTFQALTERLALAQNMYVSQRIIKLYQLLYGMSDLYLLNQENARRILGESIGDALENKMALIVECNPTLAIDLLPEYRQHHSAFNGFWTFLNFKPKRMDQQSYDQLVNRMQSVLWSLFNEHPDNQASLTGLVNAMCQLQSRNRLQLNQQRTDALLRLLFSECSDDEFRLLVDLFSDMPDGDGSIRAKMYHRKVSMRNEQRLERIEFLLHTLAHD